MTTEFSFFLDSLPAASDYCQEKAHELEIALERAGVALGVDWEDEAQILSLAQESLNHLRETVVDYEHHHDDFQLKAKMQLFGVACLMTRLMAEGTMKGIETHGGQAWNAFYRALMRVKASNS